MYILRTISCQQLSANTRIYRTRLFLPQYFEDLLGTVESSSHTGW